jgi:hypothetical protein
MHDPVTGTVVEFVVDSWEIECCAPPPVVGEWSSYHVLFHPSDDHPFATERCWSVVPDGPTPRLIRLGVTAAYASGDGRGEIPAPGEQRLRGQLSGTVHVFPPDLPPLAGTVRRVRVVSEEFVLAPDGPPRLRRVPGSLRCRETDRSPRWFSQPEREASRAGAYTPLRPSDPGALRFEPARPSPGRHETGVVVEVVVPPDRRA